MPFITGPGVSSFSNLKITAAFELTAGSTLIFPEGRMPVAIYSNDGDFDDLNLEGESADGWEEFLLPDLSAVWIPNAQEWNGVPWMVISDGVSFRLRNAGANPITGIQYYYMEI